MEERWLRVAHHLIGRLDGPLHFRFILQPLMSITLAIRDGLRDAHRGDHAYLWSICKDRDHSRALLLQGWKAVGRVFFLALAIDVIYQIIAFRTFYPLETLITAVLLAIVPYILLRGPINRVVRLVVRDASVSPSAGGDAIRMSFVEHSEATDRITKRTTHEDIRQKMNREREP